MSSTDHHEPSAAAAEDEVAQVDDQQHVEQAQDHDAKKKGKKSRRDKHDKGEHTESKAFFLKRLKESRPDTFDPDLADGDTTFASLYETEEEASLLQEVISKAREHVGELADHDLWPIACLRGRKYDIERAVQTMVELKQLMDKYDILSTPPKNDLDVASINRRSNFHAYGNVDVDGRWTLYGDYGNINFNNEDNASIIRATYLNIETTLRTYPRCQVDGITFFIDLSLMRMSHFDSKLEKELAETFTKTFPIRIGYMLYWNAPWYLRALLPIVKLFLKKKMRNRLHIVHHGNIHKYIADDQFFTKYGGKFEADIPDLTHVE